MKRRLITIQMPEDAFDTIIETLQCDAQSSAFDSDLREEIQKALDSIEVKSITSTTRANPPKQH